MSKISLLRQLKMHEFRCSKSEIKIYVLIDEKNKELAVLALHDAYELEKSSGK